MLTNNEIKYYVGLKNKKTRNEEGKFLIEGLHLIRECLASKFYYKDYIESIIVRDDFNLSQIPTKDIEVLYVSEKNFDKISDTVNPQGIIAVVRKPEYSDDYTHSNLNLIVALENINDPGNLGTILRTCYWFNAGKILVSAGSVDLYNSKVLRASQGAVFHTNVRTEVDLYSELEKLSSDHEILLTDLSSKKSLSELNIDKNKKYVIVFGNEANGISDEIKEYKYDLIKIDNFTDCESLNLSVSAGIILNKFANALK